MDNKDSFRPIPEERLKEMLGILLPYGYSHYGGTSYTGVSPYINDGQNIITIVANNESWEAPFSICMEHFDEGYNEVNSLGFYKGIMKLIAPELKSGDEEFKGNLNILDFNWVENPKENTPFPVSVTINLYKAGNS